jgi:hypothetical protein
MARPVAGDGPFLSRGGVAVLEVAEESDQNDDWNRYSQQQKQYRPHISLLEPPIF